MKYGNKTNYRKINLYDSKTGKYLASTTWARTLKEAQKQYYKKYKKTAWASYQ